MISEKTTYGDYMKVLLLTGIIVMSFTGTFFDSIPKAH